LVNSSKEKPIKAEDLAAKTGINRNILEPLLHYMTTQFMAHESSQGQYTATKVSHVLLKPLFLDGIIHL
jgi:hypothetical protein